LKLAIAGDGPAREELELHAAASGVADRVRFLGTVDRSRLPDVYASADAFVMPSTTETQGLVQAEALASGAFVIAADAGPNRDVLGAAGLIVEPTATGFAGAFAAVPAQPRREIAELARRTARRFSIAAQVDRMLELYASLLPGEPGMYDPRLTSNIRSL